MDFTKKGLNQTIFSKKSVIASTGRNSSAFKAILGDKNLSKVINKDGEKRVFYDALKKRGLSADKGITRNVLKKVLGDVEHSGEFSHHEMMDLRKHLVGGPVSSSIVRDYASCADEIKKQNKPTKNMREIYHEIMDKGHQEKNKSQVQSLASAQNSSQVKFVANFRSNVNIREADALTAKGSHEQTFHRSKYSSNGDGDIKARLKSIQSS